MTYSAATGTGIAELWQAVLDRLDTEGQPWELQDEVLPVGTISHVVGPLGLAEGTLGLGQSECPVAPELLRVVGR
mgnify:CR=1 FL=1